MDRRQARRAAFPTALLLLIFVFVWGCEPRSFTDLRLTGVNNVPISELPASDKSPLAQEANGFFKVSLLGTAQWIRDVKRLEMNSYAIILRCDRRDARLYAFGPYVGEKRVTAYDEALMTHPPSTPAVRYDVYLPRSGRYTSEADFNMPQPSYDLRRERLKLCLSIAGGSMAGAYGRSNEVRLEIGPS